MHATFLSSSEYQTWSEVKCISTGMAPAVAQVGIAMDNGSRMRVDIQADAGYSCWQDVRCIGNVAYIGYGDCLFVVHPHAGTAQLHSLDGYFGQFHSAEALERAPLMVAVIVASASELLGFSMEGMLQWRTGNLGIDGVRIESVQGDVVRGSGEWDPPGGWSPFCLSLRTGEKLAGTNGKA